MQKSSNKHPFYGLGLTLFAHLLDQIIYLNLFIPHLNHDPFKPVPFHRLVEYYTSYGAAPLVLFLSGIAYFLLARKKVNNKTSPPAESSSA